MPQVRPAGPYALDGVRAETWLVRFDKKGVCTSPRTRDALLGRLKEAKTAPIIFFSHGWNNDFADAVELYRRFLIEFEKVLAAQPLKEPAPIFVGATWPSIWFPSDDGPQFAGAPAADNETAARERFIRQLQETLPDETDWERLYVLLEAERLDASEAEELARLLQPLVAARQDDEGTPESEATAGNILQAMQEMQAAAGPPEEEDLEDVGIVGAVEGGSPGGPGTAGILQYLDPRWAVRLGTLYLMKDRAGTVGWVGIAALLRGILAASGGPVHLVGHSYGCKVMLSGLINGPLARKVQSLLLLQPAVSHLCFADKVPGREGAGGYRGALDRVEGPIFSTYSAHDFPLHSIYHHALVRRTDLGELGVAAATTAAGNPPNAYAALGGYGPRGAGEFLTEPLPKPDDPIPGGGKRLVAFDGSRATRIGGHGDVVSPSTAGLLRRQMG